jgi:hypothetical protein
MGDGIAILSFKTKMHTISNEVLDGILRAVTRLSALPDADPVAGRAPFSAARTVAGDEGQKGAEEATARSPRARPRASFTVAGGGG